MVHLYTNDLASIRRPSVICLTFSEIFSKATWPIKAKFHVESLLEGGKNVCINGPGHMTKMAATPIYGKAFKNIILLNQKLKRIHISFACCPIHFHNMLCL